ncbi:hypothetical protein FRB90_000649 [Tulasnella sp. 427]|nr:hypothetical protein FRB90_000649 [Tulasnella sp. 427]
MYTFTSSQFFNFNFVGTGVYVVGTASLEGGVITFNLDGVTSTFDRYSTPPYKCGIMFFAKGGLENTAHTLTASLTGPSPENSTVSEFFEYQYIQYTQVDLSDTLTPSSSSTAASSSSVTTSTATGAPTQPGGGKVNAGAIGGGIAAGVVGLLIIGFIIWFCMRRNKQEKAAVAKANRPEIDPPRQSFVYSPVGAAGFGRLSHDGGSRRQSMSGSPGATTTSGPWNPDARIAANLAPHSDPAVTQYPPGAAAPSVVHSSHSSGDSPVRTYSSAFPHSSASNYAVQNPGPGGQTGMMGASSLPESDVERIAARVASMMNQPASPQPLPPGARPPKGGASPPTQHASPHEEYDQPPPMYEPRNP